MRYGIVFVWIVVAVVALVLGPWITIQAVNHLFSAGIEFTFWSWLSMFWLHILVASRVKG